MSYHWRYNFGLAKTILLDYVTLIEIVTHDHILYLQACAMYQYCTRHNGDGYDISTACTIQDPYLQLVENETKFH